MNSWELNDFVSGFLEAIVFTEDTEDNEDGAGTDFSASKGFHPSVVRMVREECKAFYEANAIALSCAANRVGYSWASAGHDFWLTRNGHGAGFWDRQELKAADLGRRLSEACKHKECSVYLGDDGFVYVQGLGNLTNKVKAA